MGEADRKVTPLVTPQGTSTTVSHLDLLVGYRLGPTVCFPNFVHFVTVNQTSPSISTKSKIGLHHYTRKDFLRVVMEPDF